MADTATHVVTNTSLAVGVAAVFNLEPGWIVLAAALGAYAPDIASEPLIWGGLLRRGVKSGRHGTCWSRAWQFTRTHWYNQALTRALSNLEHAEPAWFALYRFQHSLFGVGLVYVLAELITDHPAGVAFAISYAAHVVLDLPCHRYWLPWYPLLPRYSVRLANQEWWECCWYRPWVGYPMFGTLLTGLFGAGVYTALY